jgi:hypothetical protein
VNYGREIESAVKIVRKAGELALKYFAQNALSALF